MEEKEAPNPVLKINDFYLKLLEKKRTLLNSLFNGKYSGKTQGIWFAQVVNSQILKVKNISILAAKFPIFFEAG